MASRVCPHRPTGQRQDSPWSAAVAGFDANHMTRRTSDPARCLDPPGAATYVLIVFPNGQSVRSRLTDAVKLAVASEPDPGLTEHPSGPLLYRVSAQRPLVARLVAGLVFGACATLLIVASRLQPDPSGMGTHRQLGQPPCMVITFWGYPCPTCGMTTAFAHTIRGELLSAFKAQPAGLALALAAILAGAISLGVAVTGKVWMVNWFRISPKGVVAATVVLLAGGWFYKIAAGVLTGVLPYGR